MKVIEYKGQRVLTSGMIAESYGTDAKTINKNFTRNSSRYQKGKHYFSVEGDELKRFKTDHQIDGLLKHSKSLHIWTIKGALLHAKSLGSDEAWEAYELLVDDYFKIKEASIEKTSNDMSSLSPTLQVLIGLEQRQNAYEAKQVELQAENEELRKDMKHLSLVVDNEVWVTESQKSDMRVAVNKRIGELKTQHIDGHFQGLYGDLKTFFRVSKYDKIARKDFEQAMEFIKGWFPKTKENLS